MPGYDGYERKPFTCMVGDIECHGTAAQEKWTRTLGSPDAVYYTVGVVVAGIREYTFEMLPAGDSSLYRVFSVQRRSAVRDLILEEVQITLPSAFPDVLFQSALEACVDHYKARPPRFVVPAENVGEL